MGGGRGGEQGGDGAAGAATPWGLFCSFPTAATATVDSVATSYSKQQSEWRVLRLNLRPNLGSMGGGFHCLLESHSFPSRAGACPVPKTTRLAVMIE